VISLVHEPVVVKRLCLYVDRFNPPYAGLIKNLISHCEKYGISLGSVSTCADHLKDFNLFESKSCDMAIVLGGDGTILRGLDHFRELNVPVLGVNTGHLGFLASAEKAGLEETIARISEGDYYIDTTPVLRAEFPSGQIITAVNDFSINRSMMGGILYFNLYVNNIKVARMAGDGLVISTPFGSTAYSLSCGGPILDPGLPAILVVPISPHSLSLRPLVVSDDSCVSVEIGDLRSTGPVISADGSPSGTLKSGEVLKVTGGNGSCMSVRFHDEPGYYSRLGLKLGWGVRG
jgi:NAD+ kinase